MPSKSSLRQRLDELPERRSDSDVEQTCVAWLQCAGWPNKRLLVGKRFKRKGKLIWNTVSVITNLQAARLQESSQNDPGFARKAWQLYSSKMGMENYFKDVLIDLSGHQVPCNKLSHNRGYYALLSLAYNLSRGIDLIGGQALAQKKSVNKPKGTSVHLQSGCASGSSDANYLACPHALQSMLAKRLYDF